MIDIVIIELRDFGEVVSKWPQQSLLVFDRVGFELRSRLSTSQHTLPARALCTISSGL